MDDGQPASQHVVIQELGFLLNLVVTASTEECYSEVLPYMAESSGRVLVHYPTVGAESDPFPLVGVMRDGDPVQALRLVELVDHILPLGEYHRDQRTSLILV